MDSADYFAREYFTLHPGKARYLDYLIDQLERAGVRPGRVLDVGSGYGLLLARLRERGWQASGLELSAHACEVARASGLAVECGSAEATWPFPAGGFRAVVMNDVLEHLTNPGLALGEARRVLEPQGVLLLVTTNRWSLARPLLGRRWAFYQDPTHVRPFTTLELRHELEGAGFDGRITAIFNFFTAGESAPRLKPLRRLGTVLSVPWIGESLLAVARPMATR
jgi:SAM-dependent methyltransferase